MSTQVTAHQEPVSLMEQVIVKGDLRNLSDKDRTMYYVKVCESVGLNPLTKPFEYIVLNSKMVLYALRSCTDQLRMIHKVSVEELIETEREGVFIVTCKVKNGEGRTDIAKGAVNIAGLKGEMLANALMKAETKSKRRATLSICGLGMLDEIEVETIPGAMKIEATNGEASAKQVFGSAKAMKDKWGTVRDALLACKTHAELEKVFMDSKADFASFKAVDEQLYDSLVQVGVQRRNAIQQAEIEEDNTFTEAELEAAQASGLADKPGLQF